MKDKNFRKKVREVMSNSKSEDTSLDDIFKLYELEVKARDALAKVGYEFVDFKEAIDVWHKSQQAKLLQVIEDEVIGEDVKYKTSSRDSDQFANSKRRSRNALKAEQRQALKQIKERYE